MAEDPNPSPPGATTPTPPPPAPKPEPEDPTVKRWWEHSGFQTLVVTLWGIWSLLLSKYLEQLVGIELTVSIMGSVVALLGFIGINVVVRNAETRGKRIARAMRR